MNNRNFTTSFTVKQTPEAAFAAVNNVRGWWSEEIEGSTDKLNAEFKYHYEDVHRCKMKITEFFYLLNFNFNLFRTKSFLI